MEFLSKSAHEEMEEITCHSSSSFAALLCVFASIEFNLLYP